MTSSHFRRCHAASAAIAALTFATFPARAAPCEPGCTPSEESRDETTSATASPQTEIERWGLELGAGVIVAPGNNPGDASLMLRPSFVGREMSPRLSLTVTRRLFPHVSLALAGATLAPFDYASQWFDSDQTDPMFLRAQSMAAYLRFDTSLVPHRLSVFAQIGGGLGIGEVTGSGAGSDAGIHVGPLGAAAAGTIFSLARNLGVVVQGGYESAHIFRLRESLYRPESGGLSLVTGLRLQGSDL